MYTDLSDRAEDTWPHWKDVVDATNEMLSNRTYFVRMAHMPILLAAPSTLAQDI